MTKIELNSAEQYLVKLLSGGNKIIFGDNLKDDLVKHFQKSNAATRKAIERAVEKGLIQSSSPVSFGGGTFAYYEIGKKITFDELLGITRDKKPPMHRILLALKKNSGILSYYKGLKISSSPIVSITTKVTSLDSIIEDLKFYNLVCLTLRNEVSMDTESPVKVSNLKI